MRHAVHKFRKVGRFENTEHVIDILLMVIMITLGAVMLFGLLTANGHVTW